MCHKLWKGHIMAQNIQKSPKPQMDCFGDRKHFTLTPLFYYVQKTNNEIYEQIAKAKSGMRSSKCAHSILQQPHLCPGDIWTLLKTPALAWIWWHPRCCSSLRSFTGTYTKFSNIPKERKGMIQNKTKGVSDSKRPYTYSNCFTFMCF